MGPPVRMMEGESQFDWNGKVWYGMLLSLTICAQNSLMRVLVMLVQQTIPKNKGYTNNS